MASWAVRAGLVSVKTLQFHRIRWYGRIGPCAEYPDGRWPSTVPASIWPPPPSGSPGCRGLAADGYASAR